VVALRRMVAATVEAFPFRTAGAFVGDPLLGGGTALGEERPGGGPEGLHHVDEVANDLDLDLTTSGHTLMQSIWWLVPSKRVTQVPLVGVPRRIEAHWVV
jgi:hypothetical protein